MIPFSELSQPDQTEVLHQLRSVEEYPACMAVLARESWFFHAVPSYEIYAVPVGDHLEITLLTRDMTRAEYRQLREDIRWFLGEWMERFPGMRLVGRHRTDNLHADRLFTYAGFRYSQPRDPQSCLRTLDPQC